MYTVELKNVKTNVVIDTFNFSKDKCELFYGKSIHRETFSVSTGCDNTKEKTIMEKFYNQILNGKSDVVIVVLDNKVELFKLTYKCKGGFPTFTIQPNNNTAKVDISNIVS